MHLVIVCSDSFDPSSSSIAELMLKGRSYNELIELLQSTAVQWGDYNPAAVDRDKIGKLIFELSLLKRSN